MGRKEHMVAKRTKLVPELSNFFEDRTPILKKQKAVKKSKISFDPFR